MRFIATADWQLGMTAAYLGADARPRFAQARLDAVRAIGELARDRGAELVVVCGDVFESNQLDRQVVPRALEVLRDFTVPVYLLPGNHDPLDPGSIYRSDAFRQRCPDHVHVLSEPGPVSVRPGLEIVAAPWLTRRPMTDLVAEACADLPPAPGTLRIVVGHGSTDTLDPDRDNPASVRVGPLREHLDAGSVHVCVLGDRHSTTEVADDIWYPGAPEVTDRDETDPGNVLVVDLEPGADGAGGVRVEVDSVPVGCWQFEVLRHELTGPDDVTVLAEHLDAWSHKDRTALWLQLSGTLSIRDKSRLDAVLAERADLFAALRVWQRHYQVSVLTDDEDFSELGLTGFAFDAVSDLVARAAGDRPTGQTAQDALGLLYRLTGAA